MRVTIDLDDTNGLELLKVFYNLRYTGAEVEVYRTTRGYHIIAYGLPITQEQSLEIREILGDDRNRIRLDRVADQKPKQILWTHKNLKPSRKQIYIPSALY